MGCFSGKPGSRVAAALVLSAALAQELAGAPEEWIKLETPHFELYTTAGEKKGREAILYFEQVRSFFIQTSPAKRDEAPVRIVAFRSEGEYKPYRMNAGAVAYYAHSRNREFIVMQDISSENYPAAIHEYTHLVIERDGLKVPVWLNEGWAELYSSLRPQGNKALVGALLPGRLQALLNSRWIDLPVLALVDQNSPMYNETNKAGIFYAESWLLVHMLYFSADYRENFSKFVLTVANGQDTAQAFQSVFGKGLKEVRKDLDRYSRSSQFYGALFNVKLEKSSENPQVSQATALESGLVLADLLSMVHKRDEALHAYEQLAKENPGQPEADEALGYLAWQANDRKSAAGYFKHAYASGTRNAQMCFDYAMLESQETPTSKEVVSLLRRALELKPDYVEARLALGLTLASQGSYAEAADQLHQVKKVNPEQAPSYFLALAYSDLGTGHPDEARKNAESARKWAKSSADTEQADSLLKTLDASQSASAQTPGLPPKPTLQTSNDAEGTGRPTLRHSPAPDQAVQVSPPRNPFIQGGEQMAHIEGVAQRLDCSGTSARLHVLAGGSAIVFEIADPSSVLIKHSGEAHHDFTCGAQKPFPIAVDYAVKPDPKKGTAGIVRELDF